MDQWTYDLLRQVHAEALRPGARVVADRARLFLVPVECPRNWRIVGAFGGDHDTAYGLDWSPTRPYIYNSPLHMPLEPANFRHEPRAVADVDFSRFPPGGSLAGEAQWVFDHPATIHGLGFWFDLGLGDVWLSNEPGREPGSWGYVYLPIAEPVTVSSGSSLVGAVRPELSTDGAPVWLTWEVAAGNQRFRGHEFRSHPASLADLIPGSPQWVPEMSHQTRVELEVLKLVDGVRTVEEIARELVGMGVAETVDLARMIVLAALEGRTTVSPRAARTLNV
jgi:hypothetical protein